MRILITSTALCALLAAVPALAAPNLAAETRAERSCFRASDVDGFNVIDDQTVDVSVSPRNVYRLTLFAPSPDIDWTMRIGIEARGGGWICAGMDATIIVPGDIGGIQRYPVTQVRKLTPEEIRPPRKSR